MPGPQQSGFDVNAARQAGYSDDEILSHLTQTRSYDIGGALKAGYSKGEIIDHLSGTPTSSGASSAWEPNDYLTKTEDFIHGFSGGALKNIPFLGKYFNGYSQAGVVNPDIENMGEGTGRVYEQGLEMAATGGPLRAGATRLAEYLPFLGKFAAPLLRTGAEAVNAGTSAAIHGQPIGTSAALGAGGGALDEAAQALAPKLAESALHISDRMRGRGRQIGQAALDETSGIRPTTVARQSRNQIGDLTSQMEDAVHQATQQGATGSTVGAHNVLDDAIQNLPRNARSVADRMNNLHELLDLRPAGSVGPVPSTYSPDELLEMKRGIGQEMKTWPPEWQKLDVVKSVQQRLYGAIDSELDRIVPGNAELNQRISNLIPAKQQASKLSQGAPLSQRVAHRMAAHTGALAASGFGGVAGYREGGLPGAVIGSTMGLAIPEIVASPSGQMAAARALRAGLPPFITRAIVASQQNQGRKP
jgi:hypothetical protein